MVVDWIKMAVGAAILLVVGLAFRHYTGLVDAKAQLSAQVAQITLALDVEQATVAQLEANIEEWAEAQERLRATLIAQTKAAAVAREETERINDIFARHDLGKLARAKPGLIESIINRGTTDILRMLECASGNDRCDANNGAEAVPDAAP